MPDPQDPPPTPTHQTAPTPVGTVGTPASTAPLLPQPREASGTQHRFSGVQLVDSSQGGPVAVAELQLELDEERGLRLCGTDGSPLWSIPWAEVAELSTPERTMVPQGNGAVVMEVTTRHLQSHLLVLPADRPRKVESEVRALALRHGVRHRRSSPPAAVSVGVVALVGAAVAALLLAAGHVIHP